MKIKAALGGRPEAQTPRSRAQAPSLLYRTQARQ